MRTIRKILGLASLAAFVAVMFGHVLSPPYSRAQFAPQAIFIPAASVGGGANTITLTIQNITQMTDLLGVPVTFVPTNINAAGATTINPTGLGAQTVKRRSAGSGGVTLVPIANGDISTNILATVVWDGTEFIQENPATGTDPVGHMIDYPAAGCPSGFVEANNQAISSTTYAQLNTVLGTTWGTSGGNVVIPDFRGRAAFGRDSGGSARITVAGGNFDGTTVGNTGGAQNQTLTQTQIPNYTLPASGQSYLTAGTGTAAGINSGNVAAINQNAVTITSGGGGLSHPILDPSGIVTKCVKA